MWSLFIIFLASIASSMSCLAYSKTIHKGGSVTGYLPLYFLTSFVLSSLLNGIFTFKFPWSAPMSCIGCFTGFFVIMMMILMGKALQKGPSGLTFAFQNSGAILPFIILALIFSDSFGFKLTIGNLMGMGLVVLGLLYATKEGFKARLSKQWIFFAVLIFVLQALILTIFQWRCLLMSTALPIHPLIPFKCVETDDLWFMPAMFLSAGVIQVCYFFFKERRWLTGIEMIGGGLGGIANGLSTFFLLKATWIATGVEKAMLFPLFTVLVILLCNLYGKLFFREKINWMASALCAFGIVIGMMM